MSAVGAITHVKELQYAGAALGAVGLVGGLASGAGLLGGADIIGDGAGAGGSFGASGAGELGGIGGGAASGAADNLAGLGANASAADQAWSASQTATALGDNARWDILDMASGKVTVPTGTTDVSAATSAPSVTPDAANNISVNPTDAQVPQTAQPTDFLGNAPATPTAATDTNVSPLDTPAPSMIKSGAPPTDEFGNVISQGGGEGTPLGNVTNPGDPNAPVGAGQNAPTTQTVPDSAPPPQAVTGKPAGTEADLSGFGATRGPQGPSDLAARSPDGTLMSSDKSIWSSIYGFVKDHPTMAFGAMQAFGSFLNGSLSPLPDAQVKALAAQAKQNQAAANLANEQQAVLAQRLANMNAPMPSATRAPLGMINTGVTGHV